MILNNNGNSGKARKILHLILSSIWAFISMNPRRQDTRTAEVCINWLNVPILPDNWGGDIYLIYLGTIDADIPSRKPIRNIGITICIAYNLYRSPKTVPAAKQSPIISVYLIPNFLWIKSAQYL